MTIPAELVARAREADIFEIAQRIVGGIGGEKLRIGVSRYSAEKGRVAIGRCMGDMLPTDDAATAAHVLDDDRLSK